MTVALALTILTALNAAGAATLNIFKIKDYIEKEVAAGRLKPTDTIPPEHASTLAATAIGVLAPHVITS